MEARKDKLTVLFTSVGRRVELLRMFREAIRSLGIQGRLVGIDIDPLAPALQVSDGRYLVPRSISSDYIPALMKICERENVDLILPLIDPDIPLLAQNKELIQTTGARLGIVSRNASEIASDKWQTTRFFRQLGIQTPRSWLAPELRGQAVAFPVFIKPRKGSAAKSTFKINSTAELEFFSQYVPDPIIQEYLPGEEITNDVICDLSGEVLSVVSRQRIEVRWGEVAKGVTVYREDIADACLKIARALPAIGPVTVQCIIKDGIPYYTEINARLGGGAPLGVAAGAQWPRWLLARCAGIPVDIPQIGSYRVGLHMTRFDESYFLGEADLEQMASDRI